MVSYELHSCTWVSENELEVSFRRKTFFSGASELNNEIMPKEEFISKFGQECLPPRPS